MKNAVVIDDCFTTSSIMSTVLKQAGINAHLLPTGVGARKLVSEVQADVVFLDVLMPVKEGTATLRDLRTEFPTLPVIAMSSTPEYLDLMNSLGATAHITKPIDCSQVRALIEVISKTVTA